LEQDKLAQQQSNEEKPTEQQEKQLFEGLRFFLNREVC